MTRCPTCYRPEATDEQWRSGACGKNPEGGCECLACCSVCWGACGEKDRIYAWTKEPPEELGWYWIKGEGNPPEPAHHWRSGYWGTVGNLGECMSSDLVGLGYEFLPVPLEVPE